ncbi:methyl-accepting chemotaxis protein [Desulfarculales bacterium]
MVAGEVHSLAGRSACAAKQIQALINDSVAKVEQGNDMVVQSDRILGLIITEVQQLSEIIAEVTTMSQEQANGIDEINKAMSLNDEAVRQNATLLEEAAALVRIWPPPSRNGVA